MAFKLRIELTIVSLILGFSIHSVSLGQIPQTEPVPKMMEKSQIIDDHYVITLNKGSIPASWQGGAVALKGIDVVSFFQADKPAQGTQQYAAEWDDTTWQFSSEENRDAFLKNPEKYVPQFGGYCPVALSTYDAKIGLTNQYTVIDEKLYLNYNEQARRDFQEVPNSYIARAQLNF